MQAVWPSYDGSMRASVLIGIVAILAVGLAATRQLAAWSPPSASVAHRYTPTLNGYLASRYTHAEGVFGRDGQWYCATKLLGVQSDGSDVTAYAWTLCEETTHSQGRIKTGSAYSLPVVVHLRRQGGHLRGVGYAAPADAPAYTSDVHRLFPSNIANWILSHPSAELGPLGREVRAEASR